MRSKTTDRFWKCYSKLPDSIKKQAKEAYRQFLRDPYYPSLHFERIHSTRPIFSVRITKTYRAIGIRQEDEMVWFWIGPHSKYDELVKTLRNS